MNKLLAEKIVKALGGAGSIYEDYSGRGQWGERTTGVQCEGGLIEVLQEALDMRLSEDDKIAMRLLREDALGKSKIVY